VSGRMELACAKCGQTGGLEEEVTVECTGTRSGTPYVAAGGKVEVKYGYVDTSLGDEGEVLSEGDISCSKCHAEFESWEEAVAGRVVEYQCETCGWWGLQHWLHDPACTGELTEFKAPTLPLPQGSTLAVAS
jgi:Zn finger protein HypA/HybF involved in hydrogenase expression